MIPLLTVIQIGKAQFNRVDIQFRTENHYVDIQIERQVEVQFNRVDIQFRTENHYVDIQIERQFEAQFSRVDIQFRTENHFGKLFQIGNQVEGQHKSMMTQLNLNLSRTDFYF